MSTSPDEVALVFNEWVRATDRDSARTKLSSERRGCIKRALTSHGLDDCLAAVRHIGASAEARDGYGRGTRFDDVKHALGSAERVEKWRDWTPPSQRQIGSGNGHAPTQGDLLKAVREQQRQQHNTIEGTAHDLV